MFGFGVLSMLNLSLRVVKNVFTSISIGKDSNTFVIDFKTVCFIKKAS